MGSVRIVFIAVLLCCAGTECRAVEGPSAAGPIGGTDIRSGLLPPPGTYVGTLQLVGQTIDFLDAQGKPIPALKDAELAREAIGPFFYYIPETKVFGGSFAIAGIIPVQNICGRLFSGADRDCDAGAGDPYVEVAWSRYFGTPRPSHYAGAYPIPEGLSVLIGFGIVVPTGKYDPTTLQTQAISPGTNIWDFAPTVAITYTTSPILAEGTEFSAKLFWNNYLENSDTRYRTGDLLNLDFAVTEHIGRFQVGVTAFYAWQTEDDKIAGVSIPPDGRRGRALQVGPVLAIDMPEHASSVKLKAIASPFAENTVTSWNIVLGWIKKF